MKKVAIFCLTVCLLFIAGCNSAEDEFNEMEKVKSYVEVSNMVNNVNSAANRYLQVFGSQEKFILPANTAMPLPGNIAAMTKAIDKALQNGAKGKQNELDKAAKEALLPMKALLQILDGTDKYYQGKEFDKDNFAKSQPLHSSAIKTINSFNSAIGKFEKLLLENENKLRQQELAKMKKQGYKLRAGMLETLQAAHEMQDIMLLNAVTTLNFKNLDIEKFKNAYKKLDGSINDLDLLAVPEQATKEKLNIEEVKKVQSALKDVKYAAKSLIDSYEKDAELDGKEPPYSLEGTPEYFYAAIKKMSSSYLQSIN